MNSDGPLLSKLFFCFVNLANEIDEPFPGFGNTLLGPIGKLQKGSVLEICRNHVT